VTLAGERAVNPNTASREVLLAVLDDPATVERVLAARERAPIEPDAIAALLGDRAGTTRALLATTGGRFRVRALGGVGDVRRALEALLSAPPGVEPAIVGWRALPPPG
jgi:hypothetical protein